MKLTKGCLLLPILSLMPLSQASAYAISNADFQSVSLEDAQTTSDISGWEKENGESGIINPSGSQFTGETGTGQHHNTLFLKNNAKVSQLIPMAASPGVVYVLSFEVGYALGQTPQDYIVKVSPGDGASIEVLNPARLKTAGKFEQVKLQFTNRGSQTGRYTISIETQGDGEVHFDNLSIFNDDYNSSTTPHLETVAYGHSFYNAQDNTRNCVVDYSLIENERYQIAYLTSQDGECQCFKSATVLTNETEYASGDIRSFYQCRIGSE